ncbi:hypothetical protein WDW89_24870 [Deltaproteobacteria bacterium TL4]
MMKIDKNTITINMQDGNGNVLERHSIRLEYVTHISQKSGILEIHMVGGKTITINDSSNGGMIGAFLRAWEMFITSRTPEEFDEVSKSKFMS